MTIRVKLQKKQNLSDEQNQVTDAFIGKYGVIMLEYEKDAKAGENDSVNYRVYQDGKLLHKGTDILFRVEDDRLNFMSGILRAYSAATNKESVRIAQIISPLFRCIDMGVEAS